MLEGIIPVGLKRMQDGGRLQSGIARVGAQLQQPETSAITPARLAWFLSQLRPTAGLTDVAQMEPGLPSAEAGLGEFMSAEPMPGMATNISEGRYLDAALQGLGAAGDVAYASAPFTAGVGIPVGATLKGIGALGKGIRATRKAGKAIDEGIGALPMTRKSIGKASETGGVSRRAYHGTQSPRDFSLEDISTQGPVYDEATDAYFMSGSGDPTAYMGAHFSIEPETANKFAEGRGADWLRSRYAGEGDIGPRVIPVDVRGNYKKFKDDDEVWDFVFSQNSNASEIETRILKEADYVDSEADRLFARYDSDIDYRREVNRNALDDVRHHEDGGESLAADLGSSAREILSGQGFDGYEYGNLVEGGTSIAVFDSANIQSPYENLQKITGRIPALSVREIVAEAESKGVKLDISENKGVLNLSRIVVPEKNQGVGTAIMKDIADYADRTGQTITLTPSKGFGGSSVSRLKDFYRRFGFVENKGKNKNFEYRDTMYRSPDVRAK